MFNIWTVGYYIDLALLGHVLLWLLMTGEWTRGKIAIVAVVGIQTWNYFWACLNMTIMQHSDLNHIYGLGYQIPTMIVFLYVLWILRSGGK